MTQRDPARIPATSLIFGYGPMLPLVAAAIAAWWLPPPWPDLATDLAIIWAASLLVFVGGVRRGFGFGMPGASTRVATIAMLLYFVPGTVALVLDAFGQIAAGLGFTITGFVLVGLLDPRAARYGQAPAHFARLRPPQMALGACCLAALLARLLAAG
ncbi:DUF3429 family protein [Sphingomonas panacisoli]|uniref:DUF3429 family protein n=1 Tax=Sphingomonas panacisoli TaxID=1813879 RepID=A0A5B8LG04_9SPHN|nr:DUF3429 family protein [Sphingomonas panacisoli]QDZ06819.1 DUF3429 family protein [Sphingomonas panacisoli]